MDKNVRVFKLLTGEIIITEIKETMDDGMYVLDYPAIIIPIPAEQAGGQQGQVGFGKMMPFSDYQQDVILNPKAIVIDSSPTSQMYSTYEGWSKQVRGMDSGIIIPDLNPPSNIARDGQGKPNFGNLNTGR